MLPERDYTVGYAKPPVHTRFKKGQSGNPRGRPRGSKNNVTLLREALDQTAAINENGRRRHITKRAAMYTQLAKGGPRRSSRHSDRAARERKARPSPRNAI